MLTAIKLYRNIISHPKLASDQTDKSPHYPHSYSLGLFWETVKDFYYKFVTAFP